MQTFAVSITAMDLARDERLDLAETLESLQPADWDEQSLCGEWRVRDVVAHVLSYDRLAPRALLRRFVAGRMVPDRINAIGVAELRSRQPEEMVAALRANPTPAGLTAGLGGRIGLTDTLVHHQDIRIPLGLAREVPLDRLRIALPFAMVAPPLRGAWRARGLRVVATDLDWGFGRGPEVRGPAQAVLMAVSGRPATASELGGPGADILRRRLG